VGVETEAARRPAMQYARTVVGCRMSRPRRCPAGLIAVAVLLAATPPVVAQDSAVILTYQRFGEAPGPLTTTIAELEAHIEHLTEGGYAVLPLSQVVAALAGAMPLPERSVAITIEGTHMSVHRDAWPRFKAAGLPIALLITTGMVDRGEGRSMTWGQVREMASSGVVIGTHGAFYRTQLGRPRRAVVADSARARARMVDELGAPPELFAYPYGLYDAELRAVVAELGFGAALAQQSGAAHRGSDLFALPRFSVFGRFAAADRFRLVVDTLPLPVRELVPAEPAVTANPPPVGFTLADGLGPVERLACYASGLGAVPFDRLGASRIELRLGVPLEPGRSRINCTMPGPEGRWRWLGLQLLIPDGP
jgi:peptidoglycan/xylan/chitin deacetylase (PgdA/CDA1 family)